jgi:hypothetical protein
MRSGAPMLRQVQHEDWFYFLRLAQFLTLSLSKGEQRSGEINFI